MAKKNTTQMQPATASLMVGREDFKQQLDDRINLGRQLLARNVPLQGGRSLYPGYNRMPSQPPLTQEQERFLSDFHRWTNYNNELLTQSFDHPRSLYQHSYEGAGVMHFVSGNEDLIEETKNELKSKIENLESLVERIALLPCSAVEDNTVPAPVAVPDRDASSKVFIVHGHDEGVRSQVEALVRKLGYEPIILCKQPNGGATIIEKIERESDDVAYAIVLYTACDLGRAKEEELIKPRARQNVVFEHGYMCALLGRRKVCALVESGVEVPGDMSGIVYIDIDAAGAWETKMAKEMRAAGLDIDLNDL